MVLTFYGQSCFSVVIKGKTILFDPFISQNELAKEVDIDSIEADYIFLSHGHADHIADCVSIAKRTNATVVGAFEVIEWCKKQGTRKRAPYEYRWQVEV